LSSLSSPAAFFPFFALAAATASSGFFVTIA
jgi:hypothetical protein